MQHIKIIINNEQQTSKLHFLGKKQPLEFTVLQAFRAVKTPIGYNNWSVALSVGLLCSTRVSI